MQAIQIQTRPVTQILRTPREDSIRTDLEIRRQTNTVRTDPEIDAWARRTATASGFGDTA